MSRPAGECYFHGMRAKWLCLLMVCALAAVSGCMTLGEQEEQERQDARDRAELERVKASLQTLQEKIDGLATAQEQLARQVEDLKGAARKDSGILRDKLAEVDAQLKAAETARQELRTQITDDLAKRFAEITKGQASSGRGVQQGYEHTVQQGETLSKIAAAYKKSVAAIMKANNLKTATIRAGQKLFIPE